jgi:hypothetical protein
MVICLSSIIHQPKYQNSLLRNKHRKNVWYFIIKVHFKGIHSIISLISYIFLFIFFLVAVTLSCFCTEELAKLVSLKSEIEGITKDNSKS